MKRSMTRILTTHTGSLPRPWDLVDLLLEKESGQLAVKEAFDARVKRAVAEVVQKQVAAGVDVVNDGEQGKFSYATYVKDRLTGFEGEAQVLPRADWLDFPEAAARQASIPILRPSCNGPVAWKNREEGKKDVADLQAAVAGVKHEEVFMTAASPAVIALFLRNEHYPSREAYLSVLVDVMKEEYESIHQAGFLLQIDCPDLAMGRHFEFSGLSNQEFLKIAEANVEALNHAVANIPPDSMRLHLCWGNYEGPHHRDIPLKEIIGIVLKARPNALSFEGANPRHEHEWTVFEDVKLPDGKVVIPGVIDSTTNFIEHPELVAQRIVRMANLVGKENMLVGTDCRFGTSARRNPVIEPELVWPKLQAMAEGAALASRQLW